MLAVVLVKDLLLVAQVVLAVAATAALAVAMELMVKQIPVVELVLQTLDHIPLKVVQV
jgi:hypothetical protein